MFGLNKYMIGGIGLLIVLLAGSGKMVMHLTSKIATLKEQRKSIYQLYVATAKANSAANRLLLAREKELAKVSTKAANAERKIADARLTDPKIEAWASRPVPSGVSALVRHITAGGANTDPAANGNDARTAGSGVQPKNQ